MAIIEFARWHGYDGDEFETLFTCIVAMDNERMKLAAEESEQALPEARAGMFGGKHHLSERQMSPELFDAIFR